MWPNIHVFERNRRYIKNIQKPNGWNFSKCDKKCNLDIQAIQQTPHTQKKKSEENYIKPHLNQMFKINEKENEFKAARKRTQFF